MRNSIYYVSIIVFVQMSLQLNAQLDEDTLPRFNFRSSDFAELTTTAPFVDKTMFIKTFVEDSGVVVITAPHRFGKSTNLNMVKRFLEIEVDEDGKKKTKNTNIRQPIRDTENYDLFVKNKLKIAENETFMDYHFGKHAVIFVDFEFDNIHVMSYDIAVDHLKYIIHRTFVEHFYLAKSDRLNNDERLVVKNWCSTTGYNRMTEHDIAEGLRLLSRFLYRHYENRRVYILMDNFDSPVLNALLFAQTEDIMGGIYRLMSSIVIKVLQKNFHAHRGLISGISYVASSPSLYSLGYVTVCRFLEDHHYAGFHGLTKDEVDDVFSRDIFNVSSNLISKAHSMYGGYGSFGNITLYNTWSVNHFLLTKEVHSYWKDPGLAFRLEHLLKVPALQKEIAALMKSNDRKVRLKKMYAPDDVIRLRDLILRPELFKELHNSDIVMTFLLELGYLTYVCAGHSYLGNKKIRIPNKEMRGLICKEVKSYEKHYGRMKFNCR